MPFRRLLVGVSHPQRQIVAPGRAEICKPTGKPSPVNPQGTDTDGQNSRLNGAVLRSSFCTSNARRS